jgi:hypothetical protein
MLTNNNDFVIKSLMIPDIIDNKINLDETPSEFDMKYHITTQMLKPIINQVLSDGEVGLISNMGNDFTPVYR